MFVIPYCDLLGSGGITEYLFNIFAFSFYLNHKIHFEKSYDIKKTSFQISFQNKWLSQSSAPVSKLSQTDLALCLIMSVRAVWHGWQGVADNKRGGSWNRLVKFLDNCSAWSRSKTKASPKYADLILVRFLRWNKTLWW